jgi:ubiquinone/menaquinone biosynthesis C-methylase UbiE
MSTKMSGMRACLGGSPVPLIAALLLVGLTACRAQPEPRAFPKAGRDVAPIVGESFSTEDARDRVGEAEEVMRLARIAPGMSVADIGAGEGYYTIRLSPIVGRRGRVLAEDIVPETRDRLAQRVQRENLDNVAVKLGKPADPMLPAASFDRIFLVHMYHEVTEPYEFLWNLREGLKPGGQVIVVDSDRPVKRHGMPPPQLACEFAAVGLAPVSSKRLAGSDAYFASFRIAAPRTEPGAIKPCAHGKG